VRCDEVVRILTEFVLGDHCQAWLIAPGGRQQQKGSTISAAPSSPLKKIPISKAT